MAFIYRSRVPYFGIWVLLSRIVLLKTYYVVYENEQKDKFRFDQTGGAY